MLNLELQGLTKLIKKFKLLKYLNKIFALRNLISSITLNKVNFYRCYLIKWRYIIKDASKNKYKKILNLLNIVYINVLILEI